MRTNLLIAAACLMLRLAAANSFAADVDNLESLPGGRTVTELVKALESPSESVWKAFIADHWVAAPDNEIYQRRLEFFGSLHSELGSDLAIRTVEQSTDTSIAVLVEAVSIPGPANWLEIMLRIEPDPPHRIRLASVQQADNPEYRPPKGDISDPEVLTFLKDYINALSIEDGFSGSIMIARNGDPVFTYVSGVACMRYDVPNKLDTKFNIGSMNKMFTGIAICQLAERGLLSFDDTIIKHLPDFPNKDIASKVTIHHLLTHTSGMGDYWDELFYSQFWKIKSVAQIADLIIDEPLEFEPGERFRYSNSGPIILGLIIEKLSGQTYYDYIAEHVYKPAGMRNSGCFETDTPVENLAIGYTRRNYEGEQQVDKWYNNYFMHSVKGGPAGGGYSTVEDLIRFAEALTNNRLLSPEYTAIFTTGKVERGPGFSYAYLIGEEDYDGHRMIGHSGGAPGISANLDIFPDLGYSVAVLSNYGRNSRQVTDIIRRIITGS